MTALRIASPRNFWTGVLYVGIGLAALWLGRQYPMGSAARMGPGYFPNVLAGLLVLFGVLALVRSFRAQGPPVGRIAWKAMAAVLLSTIAFGFLLERAGLVVALFLLIFGCASASARFRLELRALLLAAGLIVFCVLVFIVGLGLPVPIVGPWLTPR
jgi:hypothetical protein